MGKFSYEIVEEIAVISERNGYTKEVNMISYNGGAAKVDIRNWSVDDDGEKTMGKGITLTMEEAAELRDILSDMDL